MSDLSNVKGVFYVEESLLKLFPNFLDRFCVQVENNNDAFTRTTFISRKRRTVEFEAMSVISYRKAVEAQLSSLDHDFVVSIASASRHHPIYLQFFEETVVKKTIQLFTFEFSFDDSVNLLIKNDSVEDVKYSRRSLVDFGLRDGYLLNISTLEFQEAYFESFYKRHQFDGLKNFTYMQALKTLVANLKNDPSFDGGILDEDCVNDDFLLNMIAC